MTDELTKGGSKTQEGTELELPWPIMMATLYQTVIPADRSPTLPLGRYEISNVFWLVPHPDAEGSYEKPVSGVAIFYVMSGPHAGAKRRIGAIEVDRV